MKKIAIKALILTMCISMTACGTNTDIDTPTDTSIESQTEATTPAVELSTEEIFANIKAAYGEDFRADSEIPETIMEKLGVNLEMCDEITAGMAAITLYPDTVVVTKAKEGRVDEVVAALEQARENYVNDTLQYPMNVAKVQSTSVTQHGNYVALIMAGAIDDRDDASESERMDFAKAENDIGVNAFLDSFK